MKTPFIATALAAAALVMGCGGAGTHPEDMSAAAHEKAADRAEKSAETHPVRVGTAATKIGHSDFRRSSALRRHAELHQEAANALRADESQVCAGLPDTARTTCPLANLPVTAAETTADGVRVTYAGAEPEGLRRHAECHAAHGATVGREGMEGCPFYQKGLRVSTEPSAGGAILVLGSDDPAVRKALQEMYVAEGAPSL